MYRLMDPSNLAAFAVAMKMKAERPGSMASEGSPMNRYKYEYDVTILCWNNEHDSPEEEHNYIRLDNCLYQCRSCSETFRHLLMIRKNTKAVYPIE
ncbi:hypothetical protein quinque_013992 [Culex quinquefasciatus]